MRGAWELHLRFAQQTGLAGVLDTLASAGVLLGRPYATLCLLRDQATEGWYAAALFDARGRPADFSAFGIPGGPCHFDPPARLEPSSLAALLGKAWGPELCTHIAQRLGTGPALCLAIPGPTQPYGAFILIFQHQEPSADLVAVLAHAATAAARHLDRDRAEAEGEVLETRPFQRRTGDELARAERHRRNISFVAIVADTVPAQARIGSVLARTLRRGEFVGRPDANERLLVAVLPETGEAGVRQVVQRISDVLTTARVAMATYPEDGRDQRTILDRLRERAATARRGAGLAGAGAGLLGRGLPPPRVATYGGGAPPPPGGYHTPSLSEPGRLPGIPPALPAAGLAQSADWYSAPWPEEGQVTGNGSAAPALAYDPSIIADEPEGEAPAVAGVNGAPASPPAAVPNLVLAWREGTGNVGDVVVACPRCARAFCRPSEPGEEPADLAASLALVVVALQSQCPDHPAEVYSARIQRPVLPTASLAGIPEASAATAPAAISAEVEKMAGPSPDAGDADDGAIPAHWPGAGAGTIRPNESMRAAAPPSPPDARPSAFPLPPAVSDSRAAPIAATANLPAGAPPERLRPTPPPAAPPRSTTNTAGSRAAAKGEDTVWRRGRHGRGEEDLAFCPRCMMGYARTVGEKEDTKARAAARTAAATLMRTLCPQHDDELRVPYVPAQDDGW